MFVRIMLGRRAVRRADARAFASTPSNEIRSPIFTIKTRIRTRDARKRFEEYLKRGFISLLSCKPDFHGS